MMRVLIADKLSTVAVDRLKDAGLSVEERPSVKGDELVAALIETDPTILVVRSTRVEARHFQAASSLQLVVRAGAGVNTIDLETASARAIVVSNCPGMNAAAVAELALAHILNADRRIADCVHDLRLGRWQKKIYANAPGLKGRTIGVIGCGAIGQAVIRRALAFEMEVVAFDPALTDDQAKRLGVKPAPSVQDLAARCRILTVHVPLNDYTRGLVNASVLAAMPDGSYVINTSRGGIVDEAALADAVERRGFRAGLDVFCDEPGADGPWTNALASMSGVYGTHHIGASTQQAQDAVAGEAARVILHFAKFGDAPNCVNLLDKAAETHQIVVRHHDRVGVLARVLEQLRMHRINVQGMDNVIYSGPQGAACARIRIEGPVPSDLGTRLNGLDDVIHVALVEI
ncbi:MAG: NAD(P)-dependent oxidoreductase [Myxococcota bacterium]|nr:NAD(P)-dependent oxidoreductase [Myxococcota bacterium]